MPPEPTRRLRSHFLSMYLRGRVRETEREERFSSSVRSPRAREPRSRHRADTPSRNLLAHLPRREDLRDLSEGEGKKRREQLAGEKRASSRRPSARDQGRAKAAEADRFSPLSMEFRRSGAARSLSGEEFRGARRPGARVGDADLRVRENRHPSHPVTSLSSLSLLSLCCVSPHSQPPSLQLSL